jgi:hypothetical protein
MPILCKQEYFSWLENHDEKSRQMRTFRDLVGGGGHIVRSSSRCLFTRFGKSIPIYPAFTRRFFIICARPGKKDYALD